MKLRRIPGTALEVFPLGLGTNVLGFTVDEQQAFQVLDAYREAGGNLLDTADSYAHWVGKPGISEEIIGRWLAARRCRDEMVLATKVGQLPGADRLDPSTISTAIDGSISRLGVEYVDLYYAHEDHGEPLVPMIEALDGLVRQGKVRYLGASNFTAARFAEALDVAAAASWSSFVALSPQYHLVHRAEYEAELMRLCVDRGVGVFPWWALASGYLTGKYRLGGAASDLPRAPFVQQFMTPSGEVVLDTLEQIARERSVSMAAVALAWLSDRPGVVAPLASATSVDQLRELLAMVRLVLSTEELALLSEVSAYAALPAGVTAS